MGKTGQIGNKCKMEKNEGKKWKMVKKPEKSGKFGKMG